MSSGTQAAPRPWGCPQGLRRHWARLLRLWVLLDPGPVGPLSPSWCLAAGGSLRETLGVIEEGLDRGNHKVSFSRGQALQRMFQVSASTFRTSPDSHHVSPWPSPCVSPELMEQAPDQSVSLLLSSPMSSSPVPTLQPCELPATLARLGPSCSHLSRSSLQSRNRHLYHS